MPNKVAVDQQAKDMIIELGLLIRDCRGTVSYTHLLKAVRYDTLMKTKPELAMELAVKGMIPSNSIGRDAMGRLRAYAGSEHMHAAQKPAEWNM